MFVEGRQILDATYIQVSHLSRKKLRNAVGVSLATYSDVEILIVDI